ncbi:Crp/Fnr family transcriptional regulator [Geobacillus thermodenitrificans]|nr:Crp/Fnr family transcriptional regulator [Geobacillus thermodenitrificans]
MRHNDDTQVRIRIGELLDICRKCPYGGLRSGSRYVQQCETCDVYREMRALGDWLANTNQRPKKQRIKKWTEKEREVLRNNIHLGTKELAKMLNRTIPSIRNQIQLLRRKGLI